MAVDEPRDDRAAAGVDDAVGAGVASRRGDRGRRRGQVAGSSVSARPGVAQVGQAVLRRAQDLRGAGDARRRHAIEHRDAHARAARRRRAPPGSRRRRGGRCPCPGRRVSVRRMPLARQRRAVGDAHLAGVDRLAHPDAAAVVDRDPRSRRVAVLTIALSSGQSATASEPSRIASVSRWGEATEPASRWSRPITIGACSSPRRDHLVEAQPGEVALAVAQPADPRRAGPGTARARCASAIQRRDVLLVAEQVEDRLVGRRDVGRVAGQRRPSGTGPCPRRTAGGCRRGRSRGRRRRRSSPCSAARPRSALP